MFEIMILKKKVYKTCITDLHYPKQQLRTEQKGAKLDHVVIAICQRQRQ